MIKLTQKRAKVGFPAYSKTKEKSCYLYCINARVNKVSENIWNL